MFTVSVQLEPPGRVPPPKFSVVSPGVAFQVPLQVEVIPAGFATCNPAGKLSEKLTPVRVTDAFGFVSVNVSVVTPFSGIVDAPKALLIVGGEATVTVAMLLVAPVPPFVDVTAPVVLFLTPAVAPVRVTLNVQVFIAPVPIVAPLRVIRLLPVTVNVPLH